jgi:hypothetical protein
VNLGFRAVFESQIVSRSVCHVFGLLD